MGNLHQYQCSCRNAMVKIATSITQLYFPLAELVRSQVIELLTWKKQICQSLIAQLCGLVDEFWNTCTIISTLYHLFWCREMSTKMANGLVRKVINANTFVRVSAGEGNILQQEHVSPFMWVSVLYQKWQLTCTQNKNSHKTKRPVATHRCTTFTVILKF